ncbi:MAG: four-carbon acid sugar kinase family protein [Acidobacteriota bacterium]
MTSTETKSLAVVADDLTGACDTACQFVRFGLRTVVALTPQVQRAGQVSVLVLDTESRKMTEEAASRCLRSQTADLTRLGRTPFYKKIDSTLKGNWVAEVRAVTQVIRPELIIVAPAFPAWGRTTLAGIQRICGEPVAATSRGSQPIQANLVQAMRKGLGEKVAKVKTPPTRESVRWVERQLDLNRVRGSRYVVCDALTDEHLRAICLGASRLERRILWVGSAGLARFLPFGWGLKTREDPPLTGSPRSILVVNGSLNPANREQLTCLERTGDVQQLTIPIRALPATDELGRFADALRRGTTIVVTVDLNEPVRSRNQLEETQGALQTAFSELIDSQPELALVVIGGDTALKIFQQVGAEAIEICGELEPGIPWGRWVGGKFEGKPVVTKAGGFGKAETLLRIVNALRSARAD